MKKPTISKKNLEDLIVGSFSSYLTSPFTDQTESDFKRAVLHAKNVIEFMEATNVLHPDLK